MSPGDPLPNSDDLKTTLDPPTYVPTPELRRGYLERRRAELGALTDSAGAGAWKPVLTALNHVRGTGAMYGFPAIGDAAEALVKAAQNGDADNMECFEAYVRAVAEADV